MSSPSAPQLRRAQVGALPLIHALMQRLHLREILQPQVPPTAHETVPAVDTLLLLAVNLTLAKDPLYELARWVDSLDLRCLGQPDRPGVRFSDDRFARALDKLYRADRATLLTQLVVTAVQQFDLDLSRIHNDCTTVKTCGKIPGRTRSGLEMRHGYSKDHRPDLRQLVFCLSICADGAVPVHHQVYPGNRNEETTHLLTWEVLCQIHGRSDFLYVADCKLCTAPQLEHIVRHGGRAITILPQNLTESRRFEDRLRAGPIAKKLLWRRPKPGYPTTTEYFHWFQYPDQTLQGHYPVYWFCSSEKRHRDRQSREERLQLAEAALAELRAKLNQRRWKKPRVIQRAAAQIVSHYRVQRFLSLRLIRHQQHWRQRRRGRPGLRPHYRHRYHLTYTLQCSRDRPALQQEARTDGVYPLLCTDPTVSPKDVLQAYKYQPRLEKRFEQFKTVHRAAPLLFKRIDRVEANMFVFFLALLIQALLERFVRQRLQQRQGPPLKLYPEDRDALHPTASRIFKTFEALSTYRILDRNGTVLEEYRDPLTPTHRAVLSLFDLEEEQFWKPA